MLRSCREGNCEWTEFSNLEQCNPCLKPRTRPKPDLTYAFPIHDSPLNDLSRFERDHFTRCFSVQALKTLSEKGIICAPTTGLRKWTERAKRTFLSTTDLACFPWAVVEFKKQVPGSRTSPVERCYCQAANASAAALELQGQLFALVVDKTYSTLPPIISFTCIGPIVRVWLTYYTEPDSTGKQVRVSASSTTYRAGS